MKKITIRLGALGGNDRVDITNAVLRLSKQRGDENRTKQLVLNKLEKARTVNEMVLAVESEFPNKVDFQDWSDEYQKWFSRGSLARFFPKL